MTSQRAGLRNWGVYSSTHFLKRGTNKELKDGLFSCLGGSLTGLKHRLLLENMGRVNFPYDGTFKAYLSLIHQSLKLTLAVCHQRKMHVAVISMTNSSKTTVLIPISCLAPMLPHGRCCLALHPSAPRVAITLSHQLPPPSPLHLRS